MKTRLLVVLCALFLGAVCVESVAAEGEGGDRNGELKELKEKQRELRKSLMAVQKRLKLHEDPELAALKQAVKEAQEIYDEKVAEKIKADAEGAELMGELEQLTIRYKEMMPKRDRKRDRAGKERPEKGAKKNRGKKNREATEDADPIIIE